MANDFNPVERRIAQLISSFPQLKRFIKKTYQYANYFVYKKKYACKSDYNLTAFNYKNLETFFGYYDKSPLNSAGQYILFHASEINTQKLPDPKHPLKIILYDNLKKEVKAEFESQAYNWQQGSRLQWIDSTRFIFNDFDKDKQHYNSKIVNSDNAVIEKKLEMPVYDVSNNWALSLNFSRLALLRPDYGYRNIKPDLKKLSNPQVDGIFKMDLNSGSSDLIITLQELIDIGDLADVAVVNQKVNHIMISPKGDKFVFLHRYYISGKRYDRLFGADSNGKNIRMLADDEMVSHYNWIDNNLLVCFMRQKEIGDHYYIINVTSGEIKLLAEETMSVYSDGHPGVNNNKMIFDTYPDKSRQKHLMLLDLENAELKELGSFFESLKYYGECRCDLHPRWSHDGSVFFDSVHSGKRRLYIIGGVNA